MPLAGGLEDQYAEWKDALDCVYAAREEADRERAARDARDGD
jgi:citrate lyase gamma subunit